MATKIERLCSGPEPESGGFQHLGIAEDTRLASLLRDRGLSTDAQYSFDKTPPYGSDGWSMGREMAASSRLLSPDLFSLLAILPEKPWSELGSKDDLRRLAERWKETGPKMAEVREQLVEWAGTPFDALRVRPMTRPAIVAPPVAEKVAEYALLLGMIETARWLEVEAVAARVGVGELLKLTTALETWQGSGSRKISRLSSESDNRPEAGSTSFNPAFVERLIEWLERADAKERRETWSRLRGETISALSVDFSEAAKKSFRQEVFGANPVTLKQFNAWLKQEASRQTSGEVSDERKRFVANAIQYVIGTKGWTLQYMGAGDPRVATMTTKRIGGSRRFVLTEPGRNGEYIATQLTLPKLLANT